MSALELVINFGLLMVIVFNNYDRFVFCLAVSGIKLNLDDNVLLSVCEGYALQCTRSFVCLCVIFNPLHAGNAFMRV